MYQLREADPALKTCVPLLAAGAILFEAPAAAE